MKTSMAYRLFRLYFNDNADNYSLFGNRVHSPLNEEQAAGQTSAALVRVLFIAGTIAAVIGIAAL